VTARPAEFVARYQTFAELGGPAHGASRVAALRAELAARGLAGFVVRAPTSIRTNTCRPAPSG